jgi:hypothetical protein
VSYDPADPNDAVLTDAHSPALVFGVFGLLLAGSGVFVGLRQRRFEQSQRADPIP